MKNSLRIKKHSKIRKRVIGSAERPRLSVFRSGQHIYAQIINDSEHKTLTSESDLSLKGKKTERAFQVGKAIGEKAVKLKIKQVVFDRGGFLYHGRIAELARGAREGGLEF